MPEPDPVYILKVDENGEPLPGASMQLKDKGGNIIDEWVSGTEQHQIAAEPGDYYMVEASAPEGYKKITEIHMVIDEDGVPVIKEDKDSAASVEGQMITVKNLPESKVPENPPKTPTKAEKPKTVVSKTPKTTAHKLIVQTGAEDHTGLYLALGLSFFVLLLALRRRCFR